MCGFACAVGSSRSNEELRTVFDRIAYRGPDNTVEKNIDSVFMVFHRLAIMDISDAGNQPFILESNPDYVLMCNGEIYNHHKLIEKYGFQVESHSDCEVILHMYAKFGLERTIRELEGVFALVLYDKKHQVLHISRDPIGVRPCFIGFDAEKALYVASEAKAIADFVERLEPFCPGKTVTWDLRNRKVLGKLPKPTMLFLRSLALFLKDSNKAMLPFGRQTSSFCLGQSDPNFILTSSSWLHTGKQDILRLWRPSNIR